MILILDMIPLEWCGGDAIGMGMTMGMTKITHRTNDHEKNHARKSHAIESRLSLVSATVKTKHHTNPCLESSTPSPVFIPSSPVCFFPTSRRRPAGLTPGARRAHPMVRTHGSRAATHEGTRGGASTPPPTDARLRWGRVAASSNRSTHEIERRPVSNS